MKIIFTFISIFIVSNTSNAGSFVDSLAKEYGKKNGCYSISLDEKKNNKGYKKINSKKNQNIKNN